MARWKRIESKIWTSQWSDGWRRPELRGRAEVQVNLRRLFASSDVVHRARVHLKICFPTLAVKQSWVAGAQEADPAWEKYGLWGAFSMDFPPLVLKFPRLPFKFLTICWVRLQNVVNVLLEEFLYFIYLFSFEQRHTNAELWACRNWSRSSAKDWRERSNGFEINSRSVRNDVRCRLRTVNLLDLDSFTSNALSGCSARHQLPDVHHCPVYCTALLPPPSD